MVSVATLNSRRRGPGWPRRGRRAASAAAVVLLVGWASGPPAAAASFALSDREKAEAIRLGEGSARDEAFGDEWTITGEGGEVTVMTPFHRLARAVRHATFKKKPLSPTEVERILRHDTGRLVLWTSLLGATADFARFYEAVIRVDAAEVRAAWTQNERTALRQPDGRYRARNAYAFPTGELRPSTRGVLAVRGPDGKEVAVFSLDLGTMR